MTNEKYCADIGTAGSIGLGKLDYCFNASTQAFLLQAGLKAGMTVLDIGCGSGVVTAWLAQQVGAKGRVIAIENNEHQLHAAKRHAETLSLKNCEFKLCSAYDIDALKQPFDLVYCRFVLHHLHEPETVIAKIWQSLKPQGIYVAEEGIVNFTFSYPFTQAWGDESIRVAPPWVDAEKNQRDGNIGVKMFYKMHQAGFKSLLAKIVHPLLTTSTEKQLLLLGRDETKNDYLSRGHTEQEWDELGKALQKMVADDAAIAGFYASCQVAGVK